MNPKCIQQVDAARAARGQKSLTDGQIAEIDRRMNATMRQLARTDPQWQTYSADQRMMLAAQSAMADVQAEAARKVANAQRQVLKTAETESRVQANMQRQGWSRSRALVEDYGRTASYIEGVKRDNVRGLMDLIEAAESGQGAGMGRKTLMFFFDAENPQMTRDLALEVFAKGQGGTGNKIAQAGAKAWLQTTENMRQRFNAAGGDVGQLDYGYLPQAHDQVRVMRAGRDQWANEVLPLLDRGRYLNEDGSRMTDAQVLDVLRGAWETISTDGANKTAPGQFKGPGARANRGSESREIHFKDGEAYLGYLGKYGVGSMYDAMVGHIGGLARDIGLIERYGPNPQTQHTLQADLAKRADGPRGTLGNIAEDFAGPDAQWAVLSGASGTAHYANLATIGQHVRNIQVFGKLAGAVLSSITDLGTYAVTVGYNRLPYFQALANIGRAVTKDARDFANAHGLVAESLISDLNRWSGENVSANWSGRLANATMRLSLMNFWTDSLRRAFSLTMMQGTGRLARTEWSALNEWDRFRMEAKGITEADWQVIRAAQAVQWNGFDMITPDAIYRTGDPRASEVAAKYIGMIVDESEVAILNPDLTTRAITSAGGAQRGTVGGEFARAVSQFKSFPIGMISRHWRRVIDMPTGMDGAPVMANRLAYAGAMMVSLTALGAIAFQTKQITQGKDPVDMTTPKFWSRAVAQGGGLGFVGDMLLQDTTSDRSPLDTMGRAFMGPTYGSVADIYELTKGNIDEAMAGKNTNAAAEGIRFVRSHAPLVNLWYARTALDQAALHSLQEAASPGYLARIKNKAYKDWGQRYWWEPGGEFAPERAPDLSAVAGP